MIILVLSGGHILIVAIALLLLFGGKKIPELMGGIGKGMKDFKKALKEDDDTPSETSNKVSPPSGNKREPLKE